MSKVNIGVVGCGSIARRMHLPAWASLPGAQISAICDCDEQCLREMSEQFGIERIFADFDDMLSCDDIDVIDICTPNFLHMPQAVAALEAGKHVMIEKPLARNFAEAEKIIQAANENDRKLTIAFPLRFRSEGATLKKFVDAGELGEIYYVHARALRRRGVPLRGVFTDKEKQGGGPLIDLGIHYIDLMLWLMGHPKPVFASGVSYQKIGNRECDPGSNQSWDYKNFTVEDFAAGLVRFDNGASMVIECSFAANIQEDTLGATIIGDRGGAELLPLRIFREERGEMVDLTPASLPDCKPYVILAKGFLDSIKDSSRPLVTGEEGLIAMKIVDMIYRSAEIGREVQLS